MTARVFLVGSLAVGLLPSFRPSVFPSLAAQDADAIASRASRIYRGLASIQADFHQVIEDRMIGTQESKGQLIQAGDAKLVMRFSDPKGDEIVIDGDYVWLYTPSTTPGQVIRTPVSHDPVYGPNVLARILDRPTERYRVSHLRADTLGDLVVDVLEFVPNVGDPLFRRAVIWFDRRDGLPRRLELDEMTGVRRTLDLSRIRVNVPVSAGTFTFKVPAGVRVVEQ
ncbi:MAG TPA: outer membrane lipoprotein carrier protein LolA [Gemmatimonadales bacterium]